MTRDVPPAVDAAERVQAVTVEAAEAARDLYELTSAERLPALVQSRAEELNEILNTAIRHIEDLLRWLRRQT